MEVPTEGAYGEYTLDTFVLNNNFDISTIALTSFFMITSTDCLF